MRRQEPRRKTLVRRIRGLTSIDQNIEFDPYGDDIPLHLEYIAINGEQISEKTQKIELTHRQKLVTIMFSGLNFKSGKLLNYAYMLDGLDDEWTYTDKIQINYSNLPPGRYRFRVKARLMNGAWGEELTMPIRVKPSPWASVPAKIAYALLLAALAWYLISAWIRQAMREKDLAMKQDHIDFITNISHELRTPLTLIMAPIRQLRKSESLGERESALLNTMERNAERLKTIGEEIMDTPKSRQREETLLVARTDLSALVHSVTNNFRFAAMEKNQTMETEIQDGVSAFADRPKVEKILVNLISNACKYTPESGTIRISMKTDGADAAFSVSDNGMGIPKEKMDNIFSRFDRLDMDRRISGSKGSGIGLNYALKLAKIHKGDLSYAPGADGRGSVFTLRIPCSAEAYTGEETDPERNAEPCICASAQRETEFDPQKASILIVEDNDEIRALLYDIFLEEYNIVTACDGMEALECLKIAIPDLVVSDIVMPHMDGFALCERIKGNAEYGHVPVTLLTAKTDRDSNMKGLGKGADAYVGKPFDPDFLLATARNLIANRKRVQQKVLNLTSRSFQDEELMEKASLSEQEIKFLKTVHETIETHMDDESYSIDDMSKELGMSYSKLYAKIKALTGQTPQGFISTYKMNRAMDLLRSGNYNVSEVADMVGSSSPFNFSRDFKKHFGTTPSSILRKKA